MLRSGTRRIAICDVDLFRSLPDKKKPQSIDSQGLLDVPGIARELAGLVWWWEEEDRKPLRRARQASSGQFGRFGYCKSHCAERRHARPTLLVGSTYVQLKDG